MASNDSPLAGAISAGMTAAYQQDYTQQLLDAAMNQGGAVAQTAAEIAHPNGSFLSLAKDKLLGTFSGVLDTLAIPSEGIAALMSQGTVHPMSWGEAMKLHKTPADVIFGNQDPRASGLEKGGMVAARFITDLFTDPLTYVTFGTSGGVMGLSKLTEIPLAEKTAARLGVATAPLLDASGNVIQEGLRHRAVSAAGLEELQKITRNIEDTLRADTIDTYLGDTNIFGRLNQFATKLSSTAETELPAIAAKSTGAERLVAENMIAAHKAGDVSEMARYIAVKQAMEDQADSVARHTIAARRQYIEDEAKNMMSRLIESNVAKGGVVLDKLGRPMVDEFGNKMVRDLAAEWIDRGGIKVFGHSVIAGARIRAAAKMIPLASAVDHYLSPGKNMLAAAFNAKYTQSGRTPDTLLKLQQLAKNKQDFRQAEALSFLPKLYQKLGVQEGEDKIIASALTMDKPPVAGVDGRLETLWSLLRTDSGRKVSREIVDGKYGEDVGRMWQAAQAVRQQMKKNLVMMHEAGIAAFPHKNYLPGILNEQKSILSPFAKFKTSKAVNAEKAELVKWRNMGSNEEVFGTVEDDVLRTTDGKAIPLEKLVKAEERQRIERAIQENVIEQSQKKMKLTGEIEDLWASMTDKMVKSIFKGSKELIKGSTEDAHNQEALMRVIQEAVPQVDRNRVMKEYAAKYYKDGSKLRDAPVELTADDIEQLKNDLATGDAELDSIVSNITSNPDRFGIKVTPAQEAGAAAKPSTNEYQTKLKELMGVVREAGIEGKKRYMQEALNGTEFKNVISALADEWHKNPGAISRTMESILGKNFELSTIMEDLSDTKTALEQELKSPGLKKVDDRWFYKDNKDQIWERVRATAKEINDNFFKSEEIFTESALKSAVQGSLNAIRSASSREMLDDIAKNFGIPASKAPSDFVQLGIAGLQKGTMDASRYTALENGKFALKNAMGEELRFHPSVAESVNNMLKVMAEDPASGAMLAAYDKLTNMWKASVTAIFPAFHGRNAISNVFQHMMDLGLESLNPSNHIMAAQLMKYNHDMEKLALEMAEGSTESATKLLKLQNKVIMTDAAGHSWTAGELATVAKQNVVAFNPQIVGASDIMQGTKTQVDAMMDELFPKTNKWGGAIGKWTNPMKPNFKPFEYGRDVGNMVESQARLVSFLVNLRKLGDVQMAAAKTKEFLFDYQNLTPFERNFMRRIMPFYTYTRKNLELQVHTLLTRPGRLEMFNNAYTNIGDVFGGAPLSDEERQSLPEWVRDGANIVIRRNGKNVTLITSTGTPFEQPYQALGSMRSIMGSLNPLIKGPIENATGYSFFNGKPLSEVTNATAYSSPMVPQVVRDFIGYTEKKYTDSTGQEHTIYVSLKPQNMNFFANMPLTPRVISTLKLMQTADMSTQEKLLQGLLAMKPDTFNTDEETAKRNQEMQKQLQDVLSKAGLGYEFTRFQLKK